MNDQGVFKYKYFSETVSIYEYLKKQYAKYSIYYSQYLNKPSVWLENKEKKLTFYVDDNYWVYEKWLFNEWESLKSKTYCGGGYGAKVKNLLKQVDQFIKENIKDETPTYRQISIFDLLEA